MQLFITVLTEHEYVQPILENLKEHNYHGSVLQTESIKHAFMDSVEPLPYFGGLSKVVDTHEKVSRPMIFVVVKDDKEIEKLSSIVKETVGDIKDKGFMYALPITYLEGL